MSTSDDIRELQQKVDVLSKLVTLLTDDFFQLVTRVDAVKAIVCELHPEVAVGLEEKIRRDESEKSREFAELQKALLKISGQTH